MSDLNEGGSENGGVIETSGSSSGDAAGAKDAAREALGELVRAVATPAGGGQPAQLTPLQATVMEKLSIGMRITDISNLLKVSRNTIYRWLKADPRVRAAYNRWKQVCAQSAETRLLAMQDTALDIVLEQLEVKRDGRLALTLLRHLGVLKPPSIQAATEEWAEREIEAERMMAEGNLTRFVEEAREAGKGKDESDAKSE
ncbi:MAG TPA: hypothetical protein VIM11_19820 [Tepidisphaeraceae bacterium]